MSALVPSHAPILTRPCPELHVRSPKETAEYAAHAIAALRAEIALHDEAVGMAAVQIGMPVRVAIVSIGGRGVAMINPRLWEAATIGTSRPQRAERPLSAGPVLRAYAGRFGAASFAWSTEECLSLPGFRVQVPRRMTVAATWIAEDGEEVAQLLEAGDAIIVQHEVDHLNGVPLWVHPGRREVPAAAPEVAGS